MRRAGVLFIFTLICLGLTWAEFSRTPHIPSSSSARSDQGISLAVPPDPGAPNPLPSAGPTRDHEAPGQLHLQDLKEGEAVCWYAPGTPFGELPATFAGFVTTEGKEIMVKLASPDPQWSEITAFPVAFGLVPQDDGKLANSWLTPAPCGKIA